jgi:hypothetical protein
MVLSLLLAGSLAMGAGLGVPETSYVGASILNDDTDAIFNDEGKFEFANPQDTRYFSGRSGIPIKKGTGYYKNVLIISNSVNYGITKNISIGGGFVGGPLLFLTPRVGFKVSENVYVGGGFIIAADISSASSTSTFGFGVFTIGHSETNLSIGVGYGYYFDEHIVIGMISGTHRVSERIALISDNYVSLNYYGILGIQGIRILSKNNSFDIGGVVAPLILQMGFTALPYFGYARAF